MEAIEDEMLPDDTNDMLNGSRKGKHEVKYYDHIMGVSELQTRQKAKQQKQKAVIVAKQGQLLRCLMALGVYLRKFFMEHLDRTEITIDTQFFGRFCMLQDPDADVDSLYPKKIVYEPNVGLVKKSNQSTMNLHQAAQQNSEGFPA